MPSPRARRGTRGGRLSRRVSLAGSALLVTLAVTVSPASAHYYSGGGASASFTIKPYDYNDTWMKPLNKALSNWNGTATPAYVSKSSSSSSWVQAASFSSSWYGLYTPYGSRTGRYFRIQLNSRTIYNDASNWSNFVTSSFVHELGHRLSLDDITSGYCTTSIMSYCRNRNSMTTPQAHDVNSYY
ncbi:hypothetical protein [Microtetraspora malaysiensis]|uniref:hypothetical protein n=1 Tax=Microtetraspora malaysiensis TaxID=161358 RepID=UPI003D90BA05